MSIHARNDALLQRVRETEDEDGRLPLPDVTEWDIFPFEGELRVKPLEPPQLPEPGRAGEVAAECGSCHAGTDDAIWADEDWKLIAPGPQPVPVVLLCPLAHLDLGDLGLPMAAQLGERIWRAEAALASLGGVGRVHVNRWGDGGAHLHVWLFARPEGFLQLRGSSFPEWLDCLPAMSEPDWQRMAAEVAAAMATHGGRAIAA